MPGRVSIEIKGAEALEKQLLRIERKVAKKVVRTASRAAAKDVVAAQKAAAPKDSGDLRKSMKVRANQYKDGYAAGLWFDTERFPQLIGEGAYGKRAFYPFAVEYGHAAPGQAGGTKTVPPQPFIRNTFDRMKGKSFQTIRRELGRGLDNAARR